MKRDIVPRRIDGRWGVAFVRGCNFQIRQIIAYCVIPRYRTALDQPREYRRTHRLPNGADVEEIIQCERAVGSLSLLTDGGFCDDIRVLADHPGDADQSQILPKVREGSL